MPELDKNDLLSSVMRFLWAVTLFLLPVASFRYMPFFGSDTQVRPLSLIPAVLLMILLLVDSFRKRRLVFWSNYLTPLLAFLMVAFIATIVGYLLAPIDLYNYSFESRSLRAWITMGVGMAFIFTAIALNRSESDFRFSLKWLFGGFGLQLAWSLLQIFTIYSRGRIIAGLDFEFMDALQRSISIQALPKQDRIPGLTFEPSWLAAQIVTFYFPWAFAALIKGYRITSKRWLDIGLVVSTLVLMFFTYSRGGFATMALAIGVTVAFVGAGQISSVFKWFFSPGRSVMLPVWLDWGLRVAIVVVVVVIAAGSVYLLNDNEYISALWRATDSKNLVDFFENIYAGPRLAYFVSGWNIFSTHSWFGVGLGGVGLYMHQSFPEWVRFNNLELSRLLSPWNHVYPNTKNLYARFLSETGFIGFWMYITFLLTCLGLIVKMIKSKEKTLSFIGTASLVAWVSIIGYAFSLDSLAFPNFWLPMGILIGMADRKDRDSS